MKEECKIRYPIGTRFKCANGNTDESNSESHKRSINGIFTVLGYGDHDGMGVYAGVNGWLYFHGKWAEIISLPEGYKKVNKYYFY